jgi:predicted dehydrogenase
MLRFALLGCGRIAKRHSELLGLHQIEGACLAAVCDIDFPRAKKIADQFDVQAFDDMHEMMRSEDIDLVVRHSTC